MSPPEPARGDRHRLWAARGAVMACQVLLFLLAGRNNLGDGYLEGQWALDYSGGFVRRALLGSVVSGLVSPEDFLAVTYPFFWAVSLLALVLCCWWYVDMIAVTAPSMLGPGRLHVVIWSLVALNPYLWSFHAEMNGRFDELFLLVSAGLVILGSRCPRLTFPALLILTPVLAAVHELFLFLYFPLLLIFAASRGFQIRWPAGRLLAGTLAGLAMLMALHLGPQLTALNRETATASLHQKAPDMERTESALSIAGQSVSRTILLSGAPAAWAAYLAEWTVTTCFLGLGLVFTMGPLGRAVLAGPVRTRRKQLILTAGVLYLGICLIAIDWGRFLLDLFWLGFLLLSSTARGDGVLPVRGEERLFLDTLGPRSLYVAVALVVMAASVNLPLTTIPLGLAW